MDAWFATWTRRVQRHESAIVRERDACPLVIDAHHLSYLLVRCEALGLSVGPLDVRCSAHRSLKQPSVAGAGAGAAVRPSDTYSLASIQESIHSVASWWSAKDAPNPDRMYTYLHSVLSRATSVCITQPPSIEPEYAEFPGEHAIPLTACKHIQRLTLDGVDPAAIVGWDRLAIQLTSLTCTYVGLADWADVVVGLVLRDAHAEKLPAAAWHALRHVCLAHDELTFISTGAIEAMPSLVYFDISHNLLNAIPFALEHASRLAVLNVADNMIDSVLGIYQLLPHVQRLNLSSNRLESLCGMERLSTLEQVDLRHNELGDVGEVGRLATLPSISHIWIAGNRLAREPDARVRCFYAFALEHKDVCIDDAPCGFLERRRVQALLAQRVATTPQRDSALIEARYAPHVRHVTTPTPKGTGERRTRPMVRSPIKSPTPRTPAEAPSDAYRQRMEALRKHAGDDWLRVVAQDDPFRIRAPLETQHARPMDTYALPLQLIITTLSSPVGAALTSTSLLVGSYVLWRRFFRRIPNASYITPSVMRTRRWIVGRVTSVGDADGFRLYHTPGIPILRQWMHRPPQKASELRSQTISVRLAGVDAPEAAHFGRKAQPFADVAQDELCKLVLGRTVWVDMALIDQYGRLVGTPYVYRWPYVWPTNVSLALVRKGLATVYRNANATYGPPSLLSRFFLRATSGRRALERAEEHAKRCRLGMWSLGKNVETPGAFKWRMHQSGQ